MFAWLVGSPDKPPIFLKFRSSKALIITTVSTAIFTDAFTYEIVVPVLPFSLTVRSGVSPDSVQTWVSVFLAVYGAATFVASPFCGILADRLSSRRLPLLLGLLALAASTGLLFVGNSIGILAAGRVLQGISAAVVGVVGLALLVDTVGPEEIGQAMGFVGISISLAILLAPMLGGIVYEKAGYDAVFAMAFGLVGLDVLLRLIIIEKKIAAQWLPNEESASQTSDNDVVSSGLAADEKESGNDSKETKAAELNSTDKNAQPAQQEVLAADSSNDSPTEDGVAEHSTKLERLPPVLYLLSSRRIVSALWCITIQTSLYTALESTLPIHVRDTFDWDSIGAGLIFLPMVVVTFLGPIAGILSDKLGARWFVAAGFLTSCPFVILLRLIDHNTIGIKVLLCALLALFSVGLTFVLTPIMAEITYAVVAKAKRRPAGFFGQHGAFAQAYGLFNMSYALGATVGPLLGGLINQGAGWKVTTLVLGVVSAASAVPAAIWTGGSIWRERSRRSADQHVEGGTQETTTVTSD